MKTTPILCIGSVLWDDIGRTASHMRVGSDVPGRISRVPGGVALNIAMAFRRFGYEADLLSVVGMDAAGRDLIAEAEARGLGTQHLYRSRDLPTDRYMAIEGANGLIAAIADAHSLEAAGTRILAPLEDGRLGSADAPFEGLIALDGNLTEGLLAQIATSPLFSRADVRVAPASPGKAERLLSLIGPGNVTLYVNCEEAGYLCKEDFDCSRAAAEGLIARGATKVVVTNGGQSASLAEAGALVSLDPPEVMVTRVTGAGDTFMAAHIAAELNDKRGAAALEFALKAAADYVSGETPL